MKQFIRYFFWLILMRIAVNLRIKALLKLAISKTADSVEKLVIRFPHYDFSEIECLILELSRLEKDLT